MTETVRRRMVPSDSFPGKIAHYAEEKARVAEDTMASPYASPNTGRHVEALKAFAKYVREMDLNEPRLETLWVISTRLGSDDFEPGQNQRGILTEVGLERTSPEPTNVVSELVGAGIEDILERHVKEQRKVQSLNEQIARLEPFREQVGELEAERDALRGELDEARAENGRLMEHLDFLSEQKESRERAKPANGRKRKPAKAAT